MFKNIFLFNYMIFYLYENVQAYEQTLTWMDTNTLEDGYTVQK